MGIWVVPIFVEVLKNLTAKFLCILGSATCNTYWNSCFCKERALNVLIAGRSYCKSLCGVKTTIHCIDDAGWRLFDSFKYHVSLKESRSRENVSFDQFSKCLEFELLLFVKWFYKNSKNTLVYIFFVFCSSK